MADYKFFTPVFVSSMLLLAFLHCSEARVQIPTRYMYSAEQTEGSIRFSGFSSKTIEQRSTIIRQVAVEGLRATKYLLKDAKRVSQAGKIFDDNIPEFRKAGGYDQAIADFRAIKPLNVREVGPPAWPTVSGRVGDRMIILHSTYDSVWMKILQWKGITKRHVDIIVYK